MPASAILQVAGALCELIRTFLPENSGAEVSRTYHLTRFDAAKTVGRKVYVVPEEDQQAPTAPGGDRGGDPTLYTFGVVVAERLDSAIRNFDDKDDWVDVRVDFVTAIRDRINEAREYILPGLEGRSFVPVANRPREVCDLALLNELGVFVSEFTTTIREDPT